MIEDLAFQRTSLASASDVCHNGQHQSVCGINGKDAPGLTLARSKTENIFWNLSNVTSEERAKLNGHHGCVVWLTGLSGAGKSTIATELESALTRLQWRAYVLDGDNIRYGLCSDLGFSPHDRAENIRRVGEVAHLMADAGLIAISAFISPYREARELVRQIVPRGRFIEVFVNAPLEVCEQRDPKGLYARARANQLENFTGISAPYESPIMPELEIRTHELTVEQSVTTILNYLIANNKLHTPLP